MPQTNYSSEPGVALVGALVDVGVAEKVSRVASVAIPFGRFVSKDGTTVDDLVKLPAASGDVTGQGALQGVAFRTQAMQPQTGTDPAGYAAKDSINVLKSGRVWMYSEQSVTPADPVYVRYTANGSTGLVGQVRKDGDTSKAAAFTGARFVSTAGAGELVQVEFSIP